MERIDRLVGHFPSFLYRYSFVNNSPERKLRSKTVIAGNKGVTVVKGCCIYLINMIFNRFNLLRISNICLTMIEWFLTKAVNFLK